MKVAMLCVRSRSERCWVAIGNDTYGKKSKAPGLYILLAGPGRTRGSTVAIIYIVRNPVDAIGAHA